MIYDICIYTYIIYYVHIYMYIYIIGGSKSDLGRGSSLAPHTK